MQYLGGKARISKRLAAIINAERGGSLVWEPFCGGAWMTRALGSNVIASDVQEDVVKLYDTVRLRGVDDLPDDPSREDILAGRARHDDYFAFWNIACAFGGKPGATPAAGPNSSGRPYAAIAKSNLLKVAACPAEFLHLSFFDIDPQPGLYLYCDPPYRGTAGYGFVFDNDAFEDRTLEWAGAGSVVYVSEFAYPYGREVFSHESGNTFGASACRGRKTERMWRLGPEDVLL